MSTRGSGGRPSTRSPTMLRWISSVPPRIEIDGAVRNSVCHSPALGDAVGAEERQRGVGGRLERPRCRAASRPTPRARARPRARCRARARVVSRDDLGVDVHAASSASRTRRVARRTCAGEVEQAAPTARPARCSTGADRAPLVRERGARDAPAVADAARCGRRRAPTTSSRNTSLKCASPFICRSGRTSTPSACHVDGERGDARVLRRRRVGAGEQKPHRE